MRRALPLLVLSLALAGCDTKKLGIAGATCTASSDCEGELQCVQSVCIDPKVIREREAARAAEARAQVERDARRDAEMAALMAELKALQDEQARIHKQKEDIEASLAAVKSETERQKLLAEKAALEAELAEGEQKKRRAPEPKKAKASPEDPLAGL